MRILRSGRSVNSISSRRPPKRAESKRSKNLIIFAIDFISLTSTSSANTNTQTNMVASRSNSVLIVDFPTRPMSRTKRSEMSSVLSKSVRFAPQSQGRFIKYPTRKENQAKWNSEEDYAHFQHVMVRDVVKCSAMLAAVKESQDTSRCEEHIVCCVGLDHLIARDVQERYRAVKAARKTHVQTVLRAQEWQRSHNVNSAANLARVSMESSQPFRERSYKVAVLSASVL